MKRAPARSATQKPDTQKPKVTATFDGYLATLTPDKRKALEKLRKDVLSAAPGAEECICYGVPAFRLNGRFLVGLAAAPDHCSFYPGSAIREFGDALDGYDTGKGTVRFGTSNPLPRTLVQKLVKARIAAGGLEIRPTKAEARLGRSGVKR
jgi:uncharacterized protein YdhG (YjbR/CyaY superfamily)